MFCRHLLSRWRGVCNTTERKHLRQYHKEQTTVKIGLKLKDNLTFEFHPKTYLEEHRFSQLIAIYKKNRYFKFQPAAKVWAVDLAFYKNFCANEAPNFRRILAEHNFQIERLPGYEGDCQTTKKIESICLGLTEEKAVVVLSSEGAFLIVNKAGTQVDELIKNLKSVTEFIPLDCEDWKQLPPKVKASKGKIYRIQRVWDAADFLDELKKNCEAVPYYVDGQARSMLASRFSQREELQKPIRQLVQRYKKCDLYHHQNEGVRFLQRSGGRCILSFDMGLGKTLVTLAYIALEEKRALVVCPKNVRSNWKVDALNFLPEYFDRQIVILGAESLKSVEKMKGEIANAKLLIVNFESLGKFLPLIQQLGVFESLVLDESHLVKNQKAKRTQLIIKHKHIFKSRILLSGTPIKNRVEELDTQLKLVGQNKMSLMGKSAGAAWNYLHKQRIYLQRSMKDVMPHLSFKDPRTLEVPLSLEDIMYYDEDWYEDEILQQVEKKKTEIALAKVDFTSRCALQQLKKDPESKILVFSERVKVVERLFHSVEKSQPGITRKHHGKIENRDLVLQEFTEGSPQILVATRQSLGVGINLQCANIVIFNDLPWSPADMRQASGRVRRLNQKKTVEEYWMQAMGKFDQNLFDRLAMKMRLIMQYAEGKNLTKEQEIWMWKPVTIYDIFPHLPRPSRKNKPKGDRQRKNNGSKGTES